MAQLTVRIPPELAQELKGAAAERKMSLNGYVSAVLGAAVDPDLGETEADRLRGRLSRAGLLDDDNEDNPAVRPDHEALVRARAAAGQGRQLSEFVSEGRG